MCTRPPVVMDKKNHMCVHTHRGILSHTDTGRKTHNHTHSVGQALLSHRKWGK